MLEHNGDVPERLVLIIAIICGCSVVSVIVLHFWMKVRLLNAGLPVKWMMLPTDDARMWSTYRKEAPVRHWPLWPFYAYRLFMAVFIISGVVLFANLKRLDSLLR